MPFRYRVDPYGVDPQPSPISSRLMSGLRSAATNPLDALTTPILPEEASEEFGDLTEGVPRQIPGAFDVLKNLVRDPGRTLRRGWETVRDVGRNLVTSPQRTGVNPVTGEEYQVGYELDEQPDITSPAAATLRGGAAGVGQGYLRAIRPFTSPAGIADLATMGATTGIPRTASRVAGAVFAGQGAQDALTADTGGQRVAGALNALLGGVQARGFPVAAAGRPPARRLPRPDDFTPRSRLRFEPPTTRPPSEAAGPTAGALVRRPQRPIRFVGGEAGIADTTAPPPDLMAQLRQRSGIPDRPITHPERLLPDETFDFERYLAGRRTPDPGRLLTRGTRFTGGPRGLRDIQAEPEAWRPTRFVAGEEGVADLTAQPGLMDRLRDRSALSARRTADVEPVGPVATEPLPGPEVGAAVPAGPGPLPRRRARSRTTSLRGLEPAPDPTDELFADALADARAQGFAGSDDELLTAFNDRLKDAQSLVEDLDQIEGEYGPRGLLDAIRDAGGIGRDKLYKGEVDALWEESPSLVTPKGRTKSGRVKKSRQMPVGELAGVKGVLNRDKGKSLEAIAESLRQDPRFAHIDGSNALLDEIDKAIRGKQVSTDLGEALKAAGVRKGQRWWEDLGDTDFEFGDAPPASAAPDATPEEAQNILTEMSDRLKNPPPLVDEVPFSLGREAAEAKGSQAGLLARLKAQADRAAIEGNTNVPESGTSASVVPAAGAPPDAGAVTPDAFATLQRKLRLDRRVEAGEPLTFSEREQLGLAAETTARRGRRGTGTSPRELGESPRALRARSGKLGDLSDEIDFENLQQPDLTRFPRHREALKEYIDITKAQAERRARLNVQGGAKADVPLDRTAAGEIYGSGFGALEAIRGNPALQRVARSTVGGTLGAVTADEDAPLSERIARGAVGAAAANLPIKRLLKREPKIPAGRMPSVFGVGGKEINKLQLGEAANYAVPDVVDAIRPLLEGKGQSTGLFGDIMTPSARVQQAAELVGEYAAFAKEAGQPNRANYLTHLQQELLGAPTTGERKLGQLFGKSPYKIRNVEQELKNAQYFLGTGFNVASSALNLSQPGLALRHVSLKSLLRGYRQMATAKAREATKHLVLNRPIGQDPLEEVIGRTSKKAETAYGKFQNVAQSPIRSTDNFNRRVVYLAGKAEAKTRGVGGEEAEQFAMDVVRATQGEQGPLGRTPFARGPVFGTLSPFTKFPTLFASLMSRAALNPRSAGSKRLIALLAGSYVVSKGTGVDLTDVFTSGGRPFGFDVTHPIRSVRDMASDPSLPGLRAGKDVLGHLAGTADHSPVDDLPSLLVPVAVRKAAREAREFATQGPDVHQRVNSRGLISDVHSGKEGLLNLLGLRSTRQNEYRELLSRARERGKGLGETRAQRLNQAKERAARAIIDGDFEEATEALREMPSRSRRDFLRRRRHSAWFRQLQSQPVEIRRELEQEFGSAIRQRELQP
jgi:hypothetical protein